MQFTSIHAAILNSMSEAVYVVDRDMQVQYSNPAAEALTGFTFDEAVGKHCHDIFCERSAYCDDRCPLRTAMRTEAPVLHRDAETTNRNGEVRQTQVSTSPFFEKGVCVGAVIVLKDITELKQAEERITRQNDFLIDVINALPHPFTVIDAKTYELKLANSAAFSDKLDGRHCYEVSHDQAVPCDSEDHPCPLQQVRESGRPTTVEHLHRAKDGSERDMEVHCYPVKDDQGRLAQVIEYCVDITDRKRTAAEREQLISDLQKAIAEVRTLSGLLPICSSCKKIRDDQGYWNSLEHFIRTHSGAEFSHGICPECASRLYPEYFGKK